MKRSECVEGVFITELAQRVSFESLDISPFLLRREIFNFLQRFGSDGQATSSLIK